MMRWKQQAACALAAALLALGIVPQGAAADGQTDAAMPKFSYLQQAGIFSGFDDGSARLDQPMTREQFAIVLSKLWGLQLPASPPALYTDVAQGRWSAAAIAAVTKAGYMNGVADGVFAPEQQMTLEQVATILVRAFGIGTDSPRHSPAIGVTSDWAKPFVIQAMSHGLIEPQVDFTVSASRADLVDSAYIAYQQLVANGTKTPAGAELALVSAKASDPNMIEVTFSDGNKQTVPYAQGLAPGKPTAVSVMYKGKSFTATVTLGDASGGSAPTPAPAPSPASGPTPSPSSSPTSGPIPPSSPSPASGSSETGTGGDSMPGADLPVLASAASVGNTKVKVVFGHPSPAGTAADYQIRDDSGNPLAVKAVHAGVNNGYAVLDTDPQTEGKAYNVTLDGRAATFSGTAPDYTRPQLMSAIVQPDASIQLIFSEPLDPATVVPTDNYTIAGLTVTAAELGDDGRTVNLYTSLQQDAFPYYLNVFRVADWSGNAVLPGRPMLFRGKADQTKPEFRVAINQGDTIVDARFTKKLDRASAETMSHYSISTFNGTAPDLPVLSARLLDDGMTVRLTTGRQTSGITYKLTVAGIADRTGNVSDSASNLFLGIRDVTPPVVNAVVSEPGSIVQVTFDGQVTQASAEDSSHYRIEGLQILKAALDPDGVTVRLQTSPQASGTLYSLQVSGVQDEAGNGSAAQSFVFGGNPDLTAPRVVRTKAEGSKLTLVFSESLDPSLAADATHYSALEPDGWSIREAAYDDATNTVTLTTSPMVSSQTYKVDLSRLTDLAGNAVSPAVVTVVGTNPLAIASASAGSMTTIEVALNRPVTAEERAQLGFSVDFAQTTNKLLESALPNVVPTDDPAKLLVTFRLPGSPLAPLFMTGQQYRIRMSGPDGLVQDDGGAGAVFAGTTTADAQPTITGVAGLPNASLHISFSDPVVNVSAADFSVTDDQGNIIPVVGDLSGDPSLPVSGIVVLLGAPLHAGRVYQLAVNPGIVGASGSLPLKLPGVRPPYKLPFAGIDNPNVPPRLVAATAADQFDVTASFSEPVSGVDSGSYMIQDRTSGAQLALQQGVNADLEAGMDRHSLLVHLFQSAGFSLQSGHTYSLLYNRSSGAIADLQGMPYDAADGADAVLFAGNDALPAPLAIEAVRFSQGKLIVTLNRAIGNNSGLPSITSMFELQLNGTGMLPMSASTTGKDVALSFLQLPAGQTGTIRLSPQWASAYPDPNRIPPDTAKSLTFVTP